MEETLQQIWAKRIVSYQESGQTMKAWCAKQGLPIHQLKYWLYKAQKPQISAPSAATFRRVSVTAPTMEPDPLWIQVGSVRISVRPGFEPQLLRDVVAALSPEC